MKIKDRRGRLALRVLVLAVAVAAVPVPCLAQEKSPPAAAPGIQASIQKVAAATPLAPARVQAAARTQTSANTPGKTPFIKTKAGIAVLAVLGAGVGYALYSTSHDRIHSAAR